MLIAYQLNCIPKDYANPQTLLTGSVFILGSTSLIPYYLKHQMKQKKYELETATTTFILKKASYKDLLNSVQFKFHTE